MFRFLGALLGVRGNAGKIAAIIEGIIRPDFRRAGFFIATGVGAILATGAEAGRHRCGWEPPIRDTSRDTRLVRRAVR
jgi:hypothetical protein